MNTPHAPRFLTALLAASLLAGCGSSSSSRRPGAPGDPAALSSAGPLPGTPVEVNRGGAWYPASILQEVTPGRFAVRYDGQGAERDEVVTLAELRPRQEAAADFAPGEKVLVTVHGRVVLGEIVQPVSPNVWRVHYEGYPAEAVGDLGPEALRRPHAGETALAAGQSVEVDAGGRVLPAKVLVASAAERWLVRFDGFGPEHDQEVGAERVKSASPVGSAAGGASAPASAGALPAAAAPGATATPPSAAAAPAAALAPGVAVLVEHRGLHHPAVVVAAREGGKLRVKYEGPGGAGEEDVASARVRRVPVTPKGTPFSAQQEVFVEQRGVFVPAVIVKAADKGQYRVRYDGFGPEHDEVVLARRLRPRS